MQNFKPLASFVAVQPGLCRAWSDPRGKFSDGAAHVISDSEDDIDVVTVDELHKTKFMNTGKTLGEFHSTNGKKDNIETFTSILDHPNDVVSVKLTDAATLKTQKAIQRPSRTLNDNSIMSVNVIDGVEMPAYPLLDHSYCNQLGNITVIQPQNNPCQWNIYRQQLKKIPKLNMKPTKVKNDAKKNRKSAEQSNMRLKGNSSSGMPPMVMLLPTLNVPIVLSKTDIEIDKDDSGPDQQIDSEEDESKDECSGIRNYRERNRRKNLKNLFQHLRDMLPELKGNNRASKSAILNGAFKYIAGLKKESSDNKRHLRELTLENRSLSTCLNDMKRIFLKSS